MGRGARVTDLPTEDIEDIWAELDDPRTPLIGVDPYGRRMAPRSEVRYW